MTESSRDIDEATRDISAARAEMNGRRDQITAEYSERLQQLEKMSHALEAGELTAKVVQDRVRQLLGDRSSVGRHTRAGRTSIGMRLPSSAPGAPPSSARTGPTPIMVTDKLNRVRTSLDGRIVGSMMQNKEGAGRTMAELELALLRHLRGSVDRQLEDLPDDIVLVESLVEFAEEAEAIVGDLETGGGARLGRLLDFDRQLLSHLTALGGTVTGLKSKIRDAKTTLGTDDSNLGAVIEEALGAFDRLQRELDQRLPTANRTLFDDLFAK